MSKIRFIKSAKIIDDRFIIKEEKEPTSLYSYLKSRDFEYFLPLIERNNNRSTYEYKEDYSIDLNQKGLDIIDAMSLLHNKTSFKKEINNKNEEIYNQIKGYLEHLKITYEEMITEIEYKEYPLPSEQLFENNYSKITNCISFINKELENWYKISKEIKEQRVSMIHGNLETNHLIKNDRTYLISWGKSKLETPILDFVYFYHNDWENIEFNNLLSRYLTKCELNENEKKLLFINLAIPLEYNKTKKEIENTMNMSKFIEYIYKTEELIRPYYSNKQDEKN